MRSFALALAFAFVLTGCTDMLGHAPSVVERCRAATSILFREDAATGNRTLPVPVSQSFATLLNRGLWTRATFNVSQQNGTGNWTAPDRVLHNVTLGEVKIEFERGISSKSLRDVNVTFGVRRTLSDAEFGAFCGALADVYPDVPRGDEGAPCGELGVTHIWRAWLDGRELDRSAYCGGKADPTRAFIAAVDAIKANDAPE